MAIKEKNMSDKIEDLTPAEKKELDSIYANVDGMINQLELSLYGTTKKNDHETLMNTFNDILKDQMNGLNHTTGSEVTSFMMDLFANDKRLGWQSPDMESFLNSDDGQILSFISDAYKNTMLKYADLNEIASQLIELKEAIAVMRDAIVSPDLTSGGISREIDFDYGSDDEKESNKSRLEFMEAKFKLQHIVKNHIVTKTLTFGTYYAIVIPYSKIFSDFMNKTMDPINGMSYLNDAKNSFAEKAIFESATEREILPGGKKVDEILTEAAQDFLGQFSSDEKQVMYKVHVNDTKSYTESELMESVKQELKGYMENITVCNDFNPYNIIGESAEALQYYYNTFGENVNLFTSVMEGNAEDGMYSAKSFKKAKKKNEKMFENISDCYIEVVDPMHMMPFKILKSSIGYFFVREEDYKVSNGIMTSSTYYNKYHNEGRHKTLIDTLVNQIVMSFDKSFLQKNAELKEIIAEALTYYDLNSKRVKFQFIPKEYVCEFKINEDEKGEGVSMIEPSLFYAKLYLMLLLFKIVSIILYSNDTKVNYIRTSGIDKNISNKIQEIARDKQNHKVNIMDLMSYTTLLKKIGNGTEMYIPMGRGGERGYETEILQGQEVQLNTELMELLRNCYILGSGVPAAIINYLNEADFAKSIETANTKMQGRVMNYQIDFNSSITEFYQMVARHSKTFEEDELIESISVTLTPPKFANNIIKSESLNSFEAIKVFILNLFFGENAWQNDPSKMVLVRELTKKLVERYLPMLDISEVEEWFAEIELEAKEVELDPKNKPTDNIDDIGDIGNMGGF